MADTPQPYVIGIGTLQAYVRGPNGFFQHFGKAEYDRDRPILPETRRIRAQAVCDQLNAGTMTEDEARRDLDKIYF